MRMFQPWVCAVGAVLVLASCRQPTQVTFDIRTDIPCERLNGTSITVGLQGQTEKADPREVVRTCTQDGTVGLIGTYAVVPAGNKQVVASVKVAMAVGGDVDVTTDCSADKKYLGCAVARRQITFVPSRSLVVPIEVFLVCKGVACDENSTCNRAGRCVSSRVDEKTCTAEGVCPDLVTPSDPGLPCFNDGTAAPLFCTGDTTWCTRDAQGTRSCQSGPGTSGVSFQCRDAVDCGPGMNCVAGVNGVLGVCAPSTTTGTPSVTVGHVTITDPSPSNHPSLSLAYSNVSGAIAQTCVLENSAVVGECQWQSGTVPPASYAPRLVSGPLLLAVYVKSASGQVSSVAISNAIVVDRLSPQVAFNAPDGGEVWPANSMQVVSWAASDDETLPAEPAGLEVSIDDGLNFTPVAAPLSNAPYTWATGNLNASRVRLRLTVTDVAGNVTAVVSNRFTVGSPSLSIQSLTVNSGAAETNDPQLRLTWGPVSAPFSRYCINVNDAQVSSCSWVNASALPATLTLTTDGPATLTAWVQSADGITSPPVSGNLVVLDRVPPSVAWLAPTGGEVWANTPHALTWSSADTHGFGSTPVVIELSTDDGSTFTALAGPLANSPSTFMWQPVALDCAQCRLRLTSTDLAGNVARVTSNAFTVDGTAPSVASLAVNQGANATNQAVLALTWGAVTDSFTSVCVNVNDPLVANCAWASMATLPANLTLQTDGTFTLTAWVRDAAGNLSSPVTSNAIVLDRVPPTVSLTAPAGGETWPVGTPSQIQWTAADARALAVNPVQLQVSTDNGATFAPLAGPLANTGTSTWVPSGLNSTQVKIRIIVSDAAGNTAQVTSNALSVVPVTPTLASLQVNGGSAVTNQTQLALTFGTTNNSFTRYCLTVNDPNVSNCAWVASTSLPANITVPAGDGTKTVYAWLQNSTGGTSGMVTSNTVTLDQTAPTAALLAPAGGELWSTGATRTVTYTASDSRALAASPIQFDLSTDNGATFTALAGPLANTSSYTWSPATTTSTQVKLRLSVTDAAGNVTRVTSAAFSLTPLTWSPNPFAFGSVNLFTNSDFTDFTLTNTGTQTATGCAAPALTDVTHFSIVADTCGTADLAPLASCVVKVRANPVSLGLKTALLNRVCGPSGTASADLSTSGGGSMATQWHLTSQNLGEVTLGKSSFTADLNFQNLGTGTVTGCAAPVLSNTADFTIANDGCGTANLSPAAQCRVQVRASPQAVGNTGTTLSRTCQGLTRTVSLSATGISAYPVQVSSGSDHMCVRLSDGAVRCWGNSGSGQAGPGGANVLPTAIPSLPPVSQVAAGGVHTCAILTDNTVRCWGDGSYGNLGNGLTASGTTPVIPTGLGTVSQLALGSSYSCALMTDQTVKCWGYNVYGQLGDGTQVQRNTPVTVPGLSGVTAIATGAYHTCAVMTGGTVKCWGANFQGQAGVSGSTVLTPTDVPSVSSVASLVLGTTHSCARLTDMSVKCWGGNSVGQLGDGTTVDRYTPVTVPAWAGATAMSAGNTHTCALFSNGTVKCSGNNNLGQLGDLSVTNRSAPVLASVSGVSALATGGNWHQCALLTDHSVKCWGNLGGNNLFGMLGDGQTSMRPFVTPVPSLAGATSISSSAGGTCAVMADSTVRCQGENVSGQVGDGTTQTRGPAVPVAGLTGASQVVQNGRGSTCALMTDRSVLCWGHGGYLGDGTSNDSLTPTAPQVPNSVVSLSMGDSHTCAALASGQVYCWGDNWTGQLGDGTATPRLSPVPVLGISTATAVSTGYDFSCALLADKTVWCWGNNIYGQMGDGTNTSRNTAAPVSQLSGATRLASTYLSSCAVLTDRTAKCWGYNANGALGLGTLASTLVPLPVRSLSGINQLTLSYQTGCANLADGTTRCWGGGGVGQLGNGALMNTGRPSIVPGLTGAIGLSSTNVGGLTVCALQSSGTPACWGDNYRGQTLDPQWVIRTVSGY